MGRSYSDAVCDIAEGMGCEVLVDTRGGKAELTIWHSFYGPVVAWTAFSGSSEEAARFAMSSLDRVQELLNKADEAA